MLAVLDANVLYPFQLRNFLLHLAAADAFEPLWSDLIIDEVRRNLLEKALTEEQWTRLDGRMRASFPEAWGHGFEGRIESLDLPDQDDRHVLALAVHYEADVIVTWNTKDFPKARLKRHGLEPLRPPTFIEQMWRASADAVFHAAERHRLSLSKSMLSPEEYLESLAERAQLRRLALRLKAKGFLDR